MSVLKIHRTESKAEYLNNANQIYIETINFLSRLSSRYSRILSSDIAHLASEVVSHAEKANSIYPSSADRIKMRERHLLESRAALNALDVGLTHCYQILSLNPQGAFTRGNGQTISSNEAIKRLDNMAQSLGERIDKQQGLLVKVMESDKSRKINK